MHPHLLLSAFLQLLTSLLSAQQNDIVKNQGITSPLHQANVGKIVFTSRPIALSQLREEDFLNSFELTNKSDLFITAFMGNSLTNYIHSIAPGLSADSLTKIGGYQFSLSIDKRFTYKSNIQGAPRPQIRDTETTISKPLIDNQHEGTWWTQFFWIRFLRNGGDSALTDGEHALKMEIRPYAQLASGLKVGDIIASGELSLQVRRNPVIDVSKIRLNHIDPYAGFAPSTEKFDSNRIKALKGAIAEGVFKHINSIIVVKNGKLLIEEYFNGEGRETLHDPRSVGKSFASTMIGIAEKEGYLKSEDQTLKEFYDLKSFSNYSPQKEDISLRDL